uniref:Uncharacterized protein n=1 Tax=Pyxicephalus adspersus TaxID=30357 RepID=A0AAV3AEH7_PYXAD|nr:TPA: hypothetical protein GDO54_018042 [Pyxicephalus adspersus]
MERIFHDPFKRLKDVLYIKHCSDLWRGEGGERLSSTPLHSLPFTCTVVVHQSFFMKLPRQIHERRRTAAVHTSDSHPILALK